MQIFTTQNEVNTYVNEQKFLHNKQLGFVPTMGSLHTGHLSLVQKSQKENDITVCSIFINPTQFNDSEDFEKYPRNFNNDIALLESIDCDILFLPSAKEMYPNKMSSTISFGILETKMEGAFRKGHFNGVGVVLSKLFHAIPVQNAYFGQKDLQQYLIVKQLVSDFNFDINIISCPIHREQNGLAMSSRNERLSPKARDKASVIFRTLNTVEKALKAGLNIADSIDEGIKLINQEKNIQLEYLEVVNADSLSTLELTKTPVKVAICIACFLENVRLIDNAIIELKSELK